jgi:prepilin-type N-terminal cleavage/methylation domain-containing protein
VERAHREIGGTRGFVLIELIVVMAILAIITASVIPLFQASMHDIKIRSARSNFVSTLAFAQEKAVADSTQYRVYMNEREGRYWVEYLVEYDEDGEKVFAPVEEKFGQAQFFPDYYSLQRPSASRDRKRSAYYITCYPNGASDRVLLTFRDATDRRRRFTVETLGVMGKIKVEVKGT